jgi:hypothetical protein
LGREQQLGKVTINAPPTAAASRDPAIDARYALLVL